jgi:alpha-tubulin suppressor-like RCC1 family protein
LPIAAAMVMGALACGGALSRGFQTPPRAGDLQRRCEGGDAEACYLLGVATETGALGGEEDLAAAKALYMRACTGKPGGHRQSCERALAFLTCGKPGDAGCAETTRVHRALCSGVSRATFACAALFEEEDERGEPWKTSQEGREEFRLDVWRGVLERAIAAEKFERAGEIVESFVTFAQRQVDAAYEERGREARREAGETEANGPPREPVVTLLPKLSSDDAAREFSRLLAHVDHARRTASARRTLESFERAVLGACALHWGFGGTTERAPEPCLDVDAERHPWRESAFDADDAEPREDERRTVRPRDAKGARAIAVGDHFTCALIGDAEVRCFGDDRAGELGPGAGLARTHRFANARVRDVQAGAAHACVLLESGAVHCWGSDVSGALGGSSPSRQVLGLPPARAIAVGAEHTCALLEDGNVRCWGAPAGRGPFSLRDKSTGFGRAVRIAAGAFGTCALDEQGTVRCWGPATSGRVDVVASGVERDAELVVAERHVCTRARDGAVRCHGAKGGSSEVLTRGAARLAASGPDVCAVTSSGATECWRLPSEGRGAPSRIEGSLLPSGAGTARDVRDVALGPSHACVLSRSGIARCIGEDDAGELGSGEVERAPSVNRVKPSGDASPSAKPRADAEPRGGGGADRDEYTVTPIAPREMLPHIDSFHPNGAYVARYGSDGCDVWTRDGTYVGTTPSCDDWWSVSKPPPTSADGRYRVIGGTKKAVVDSVSGDVVIRLSDPPLACGECAVWHSREPKFLLACGRHVLAVDVNARRVIDRTAVLPGYGSPDAMVWNHEALIASKFVDRYRGEPFDVHALLAWRPGERSLEERETLIGKREALILDPLTGSAWATGTVTGPYDLAATATFRNDGSAKDPSVWHESPNDDPEYEVRDFQNSHVFIIHTLTPHNSAPSFVINRHDLSRRAPEELIHGSFDSYGGEGYAWEPLADGSGVVVVFARAERSQQDYWLEVHVARAGRAKQTMSIPCDESEYPGELRGSPDGSRVAMNTGKRLLEFDMAARRVSVRPLPSRPGQTQPAGIRSAEKSKKPRPAFMLDAQGIWVTRADGVRMRQFDDHWFPAGDEWAEVDDSVRFRLDDGDALTATFLSYEDVHEQFLVPGLYQRFLRGEPMPPRPTPKIRWSKEKR